MKEIIIILLISTKTVFTTFMHEPSYIALKPSEKNETMDFGFSMGYQTSGKLVVGAPHSDLNGRVYTCPTADILKKNTICKQVDINVEKLASDFSRDASPHQQFCLGASIAATSDFFLTCAPLWISNKENINVKGLLVNTTGTCFVYNGTAYRYNGMYEQRLTNDQIMRYTFSGGVGWTTLVDEENGLILISKYIHSGDFSYISLSNPLGPAVSVRMTTHSDFGNKTEKSPLTGSGLGSGRFKMGRIKRTFYVFNVNSDTMTGEITFLSYNTIKNKMVYHDISIYDKKVNTMFGSTIHCADLTGDGYSELFVGAPTQSLSVEEYEAGAVHIYMGDLNEISESYNMRSILGEKTAARFGRYITSADIDKDGIPEVFVSAPYEDFGTGAVYVLSGSEIYKELIKKKDFYEITLSQLKSTQRIQNTEFKSFGFSLQVMSDIDDNGCDDLAVGSPESGKVIVYRSLATVYVHVSTELASGVVLHVNETLCNVRVTLDVNFYKKPANVKGKLKVTNSIIGDGVQIYKNQQSITYDLSTKVTTIEQVVIVMFNYTEPGSYMFKANVELDPEYLKMLKNRDFDSSWVVLSQNSTTESNLRIEKRCLEDNCTPQLNMTLEWSGSSPYKLGSNISEIVTLVVHNHGNNSYAQTCADVKINGAMVKVTSCEDSSSGGYKCFMPAFIPKNDTRSIEIVLDMSEITNLDEKLQVDVSFYNYSCTRPNFIKLNLEVFFVLDTDVIAVNGSCRNLTVTDQEILKTEIKTISDAHEYAIENNGMISWEYVSAVIILEKKPFVQSYDISTTFPKENCKKESLNQTVTFTCIFSMKPHSKILIIPTTEILKGNIEENVVDGITSISSTLVLHLTPTTEQKNKSLTTIIHYNQELTIGQNKFVITLIALIVALIILGLIMFALYKIGFFNRTTKKKLLEEKREEEFKRSVRRPAVSTQGRQQIDVGNNEIDIQVINEPLQADEYNEDASNDTEQCIKDTEPH